MAFIIKPKDSACVNKKLHKWDTDEEGNRSYNPLEVRVPRIEFVSCWDFYPDPNATTMEECDYIVHRHKFNRSQVRNLRHMPYFDKDAIRNCLQMGPNYEARDFEDQITADEDRSETDYSDRYEILEYWGVMDADYAREVGIDLPDTVDDLDEVQINAWTCGAYLLRAVVNPFTPQHYLIMHSLTKRIHIVSLVLEFLKTCWTLNK